MSYLASGISKSFGAVTVLQDVTFECREGEIHGLIGENGAGKSTLLKIMAGLYAPDGGELTLDGSPVSLPSVHAANDRGIYLVPQEPSLLPYLSIAENLALGRLPSTRFPFPGLDWKKMEDAARECLAMLGYTIDVRQLAGGLSIAAQQLVECARALSFNSKFILFDEPTSPLDAAEVETLSEKLCELRDNGHGLVLISHRLSEMTTLSDHITVLRDGRPAGERLSAPFSEPAIVHAMIGRELSNEPIPRRSDDGRRGECLLTVRGLAAPPKVREVAVAVHSGEVVGFAGLIGSGRTETAECIVGLRGKAAGTVHHREVDRAGQCTGDIYQAGVVYVPEDRAKNGAFLDQSVARNITAGILGTLSRAVRCWVLSRTRERAAAEEGSRLTDVRAASHSVALRNLSGGNQQKSLIARALLRRPEVLILDEPTRGVDVGAKQTIHEIIRKIADDDGIGVVVISSELEELVKLCDRIVVFYEGRTIGEVERDGAAGIPVDRLGRLVVGSLADVGSAPGGSAPGGSAVGGSAVGGPAVRGAVT